MNVATAGVVGAAAQPSRLTFVIRLRSFCRSPFPLEGLSQDCRLRTLVCAGLSPFRPAFRGVSRKRAHAP
jgi:hypothetical protein